MVNSQECSISWQDVNLDELVFVTPWMLLSVLFVCCMFVCCTRVLLPSVMRFSASEMCVSWGGASVGGCSACLPVPHSSTATSHSHRHREEESVHTSPAHSDPVIHSPRRSEWQHSHRAITSFLCIDFYYCCCYWLFGNQASFFAVLSHFLVSHLSINCSSGDIFIANMGNTDHTPS